MEFGKKRNIEKLTNEILTLKFGIYGTGWKETPQISQKGKTYKRIFILDSTEGLKRLNNGEDPDIPDSESHQKEFQNDDLL